MTGHPVHSHSLQIGRWIRTTQRTLGCREKYVRPIANARCFTWMSRREAPTQMPTSGIYATLCSASRTRSPAVCLGWGRRSRGPNAERGGGAMTANAYKHNSTKVGVEATPLLLGQWAKMDPILDHGVTEHASQNAF